VQDIVLVSIQGVISVQLISLVQCN